MGGVKAERTGNVKKLKVGIGMKGRMICLYALE